MSSWKQRAKRFYQKPAELSWNDEVNRRIHSAYNFAALPGMVHPDKHEALTYTGYEFTYPYC